MSRCQRRQAKRTWRDSAERRDGWSGCLPCSGAPTLAAEPREPAHKASPGVLHAGTVSAASFRGWGPRSQPSFDSPDARSHSRQVPCSRCSFTRPWLAPGLLNFAIAIAFSPAIRHCHPGFRHSSTLTAQSTGSGLRSEVIPPDRTPPIGNDRRRMQAFADRYDLHRIGSCFWFGQSLGVSLNQTHAHARPSVLPPSLPPSSLRCCAFLRAAWLLTVSRLAAVAYCRLCFAFDLPLHSRLVSPFRFSITA